MWCDRKIAVFFICMLAIFPLAACVELTAVPAQPMNELVLASPAQTEFPCIACIQATQTQEVINANNQAAVNAGIVRVNAQATMDSANATLAVALTQAQNSANVLAGQIAATSAIERANAQATLNSAGLTQIAAMTQSQYNLQSTMAIGTQAAQATLTQQSKSDISAETQTASANMIATQAQAVTATAQWYDDQARQREEQRQGPIAFLWMWCLPAFVFLLAVLLLWGFWRWLKIQQSNQLILERPVNQNQLPASSADVIDQLPHKSFPNIDGDIVENDYQLTTPDDQVPQWMDEVKGKLLRSEEKDKDKDDENSDN